MENYLINQDAGTVIGISQTSTPGEILSTTWNFGIGIVIVILLISAAGAALMLLVSSSFGDYKNVGASKEFFGRAVKSFIAATLVTSVAYSIGLSFGFFDGLAPLSKSKGGSAEQALAPAQAAGAPAPSVSSPSCSNPEQFKETLARNGSQVCSGTVCKGVCRFDPTIRKIAVDEAGKAGIPYGIILALICRESSGSSTKIGNHANNGKPDCGLMQINSQSCTEEIMNPTNNVRLGIELYKKKLSAVSSFSYQGIQKESLAFAAYNCCSNGDNPNSKSNDCNKNTGWPVDLPKWACPVNPGTGSFNMCAVKNYACDVVTCATKY